MRKRAGLIAALCALLVAVPVQAKVVFNGEAAGAAETKAAETAAETAAKSTEKTGGKAAGETSGKSGGMAAGEASGKTASDTWKEAYLDLIEKARAEAVDAWERDKPEECFEGYYLPDVEQDGTPELILKRGAGEAGYYGQFYAFRNGEAVLVDGEFHLGHTSLYQDPNQGLITHYGQMGAAIVQKGVPKGDSLEWSVLLEEDINEALQKDPNASYTYPQDLVPGARYLDLFMPAETLPVQLYEQYTEVIQKGMPKAAAGKAPQGREDYFHRLAEHNGSVTVVPSDPYTNLKGRWDFDALLWEYDAEGAQGARLAVDHWVDNVDLNGDGQYEAVLYLKPEDGGDFPEYRVILSEDQGDTFAYVGFLPGESKVTEDGVFVAGTEYAGSQNTRAFFYRNHCFFYTCP